MRPEGTATVPVTRIGWPGWICTVTSGSTTARSSRVSDSSTFLPLTFSTTGVSCPRQPSVPSMLRMPSPDRTLPDRRALPSACARSDRLPWLSTSP